MAMPVGKPHTLEEFLLPDAAPGTASEAEATQEDAWEHDDGLLAVAGPIMVVSYILLFTIAAFTFFSSGAALFAVGISIVFAVVYFVIPLMFFRMRANKDPRWVKDEHATDPVVDVLTGQMRRGEAIIQIVSIPLVILFGFAVLSIRWALL